MAGWMAVVRDKMVELGRELRAHAPFTIAGALLGVLFMLLFRRVFGGGGHGLFMVFHPAHVVLSAMVTASLYKLHRPGARFLTVLVIGYVGAVGIATLSDSVIPYVGEELLGLSVPRHSEVHGENSKSEALNSEQGSNVLNSSDRNGAGHLDEHEGHEHAAAEIRDHEDGHEAEAAGHEGHEHGGGGLHLGFIEEWYIVNPAALLGILIAFGHPSTKFPHASHVLISTWASLAHVMMNFAGAMTIGAAFGIAAVLFLAVWLPCCLSDIVFPTLLAPSGAGRGGHGHGHGGCCGGAKR